MIKTQWTHLSSQACSKCPVCPEHWEKPPSPEAAWAEQLICEWELSDEKQVNGIAGWGTSTKYTKKGKTITVYKESQWCHDQSKGLYSLTARFPRKWKNAWQCLLAFLHSKFKSKDTNSEQKEIKTFHSFFVMPQHMCPGLRDYVSRVVRDASWVCDLQSTGPHVQTSTLEQKLCCSCLESL